MTMEPHRTHTTPALEEHVLDAIERGEVKMRPKWHFVLGAVLFTVSVVVLFIILLYLASFILFALHETGVWFVPAFGSRGWFVLFRSLPWLLIALAVLFIVLLEALVRRYQFAGRRPLLYSLLAILVLVTGGSLLAEPVHNGLFQSARLHHLPLAGPLYTDELGFPTPYDVHRGLVLATTSDGFVLENHRGATSTVVLTPQTYLPSGDAFTPGQTVVVFGPSDDNTIQAAGVQKLPGEPCCEAPAAEAPSSSTYVP